jgi:hypothetical protein
VLICELNLRSITITLERQLGHGRLLRYLIITSVPALDWVCVIATSMPRNHPEALSHGFLSCRFMGGFLRGPKGSGELSMPTVQISRQEPTILFVALTCRELLVFRRVPKNVFFGRSYCPLTHRRAMDNLRSRERGAYRLKGEAEHETNNGFIPWYRNRRYRRGLVTNHDPVEQPAGRDGEHR